MPINQYPLLIPLILITVVGSLGAFDMIYYHIWKFKLYKQPSTMVETAVHLMRDLLMGIATIILFNFQPNGLWFWITGGMFALDFINNIIDVIIEPKSRAPLGGLPPMEYLIHIIGSNVVGAITGAYFILGWKFQFEPTALIPLSENTLPKTIIFSGYLVVISSFILFVLEATLLLKSIFQKQKIDSSFHQKV